MSLISVYIPTHNRSKLLKRAIDSVLNQTYKNVEIIIVDDGSSDDTNSVLESYTKEYNNIVHLKHDSPQGACAARNLAIENAKGKYITGLDDDDYFHAERLQLFLEQFDSSYSFLAHSHFSLTNSGLKKKLLMSKVIPLELMLESNIVGNQVFTLTNRMKRVGSFDLKLPAWQDYDLWVRLILEFGPAVKTTDLTYTMDVRHEQGRITQSDKPKQASKIFINKYEKYSHDGLRKIKTTRKVLMGDKLSLSDIIHAIDRYNYRGILKSYISLVFKV